VQVEVSSAGPEGVEAALLALPITEPADPRSLPLPAAVRERLARLAAAGELKAETGSTLLLHLDGDLSSERIAAVGIGASEDVDADTVRTAAGAVAKAAGSFGGTLAWSLDPSLPLSPAEQARAAVEGIVLGGYEPGRWKTDDAGRRKVDRIVLVGESDGEVGETAERAARVAEWANRARDLSNAPPNELFPERLAGRAGEIAQGSDHLTATALGRAEIEGLGMGAFAAVSQGAHNDPRLIVLRYEPPTSSESGVVLGLVGKAITFDTGGISLKPALNMEDMKGDMSGGAAVIEGIGAIADLGLPVRVIGVVAATENMPGGHSYRPGDILRAMNGKTIEVINTDAEGRLVLADALWYARQQGATHLVDLATLTGAMVLALGDQYAGVFANDEDWRDELVAAGEASGDHLWPLPLHPRYRRYINSTYADMKNATILKEASPALAAEFLHEFVGEGPWAHVDLAGPAFLRRSRGDYLSQPGGTGFGVRLVVELASRLA
jgi:leucyl aminopeptidase